MKTNPNDLTLENIDRLIKSNISSLREEMNGRFEEINGRFEGLTTEMNDRFSKLTTEMNDRFNFVDDQLQIVIGVADDIAEQKVEKLRQTIGHTVKIWHAIN